MSTRGLEIDLRRPAVASLIVIVLLAATLLARAEEPSALPVRDVAAKELLAMLRTGGFVLYFRHTSTDFGQSDEAMTSFEDCGKQRNLTDKGRDEARAIGVAIKKLAIPIGAVLSSPYCRTTETAQLAFGRAEESMDLRGGPVSDDPTRYQALRKQLGKQPQPQTNTALLGHGNPFRSIAGAPHLSEGEAAVVQPIRDEEYKIIARIRLDEWKNLLDVDSN
jgi:phosphohistidine phosphatase SixA